MKSLTLLLTIALLASYSHACSCDNFGRETFVKSLGNFTAQLKVVEIDTLIPVGEGRFWPKVIYRLEVERTFKESKTIDYVWMENAISADCQLGLFPDSIGQRYIITGTLYESRDYKPWLQGDEPRAFLQATTCGKTLLDVVDDTVIGVINQSNEAKIRGKYNEMMQYDQEKAKAYYNEVYRTRHHKDLVQRMSLEEFYKLMEG